VKIYRSVQILAIFRRLRRGRTCRDFLHSRRPNVSKCCDGIGGAGHILRTRWRKFRIHNRRKNILIS